MRSLAATPTVRHDRAERQPGVELTAAPLARPKRDLPNRHICGTLLKTGQWRSGDGATLGIDLFVLCTFFGGSGPACAATKDEYVYFDNVIITKKRAGPPGSRG